jgi:hypothetical protein
MVRVGGKQSGAQRIFHAMHLYSLIVELDRLMDADEKLAEVGRCFG